MCNEGDWCALYVDGEIIHQGHSISPYEWLDLINGLGCRTRNLYDSTGALGENLEKWGGRFPNDLSDVVEALVEEL
jgi:hypothetical protein